MDILKKLISLEEKRVSTLMVSMIITLAFSLAMYAYRGDISANLVNILSSLILGVVGVSVANTVNSVWGKTDENLKGDEGSEQPPI